jgi:hypothetical protein
MRTFQRVSRLLRPAVGLPVLAGLALLGLLVLSLGCDGNRKEETVPPKFTDIPIPAGFTFVPGKSSDQVTGGYRVVRHMYKGDAAVRLVSEYYRRHMPELGWTLARESFVNGCQRYMFNKDNDSCHISIYDDWGTKILIQVLPMGARPAEAKPGPETGAPAAAPPAAPPAPSVRRAK